MSRTSQSSYTSEGNLYLHLPGVIMAENAEGEVRYLLGDCLGSVRQAVDDNAELVAYHEFDPYGNPVDNSGGEPYGYTGEWWENDVGLLHLRARWYLPETGTFLSRDPWDGDILWPQSLNGWGYVESNPINYTDLTGLCGGLAMAGRLDPGKMSITCGLGGGRGSLFSPHSAFGAGALGALLGSLLANLGQSPTYPPDQPVPAPAPAPLQAPPLIGTPTPPNSPPGFNLLSPGESALLVTLPDDIQQCVDTNLHPFPMDQVELPVVLPGPSLDVASPVGIPGTDLSPVELPTVLEIHKNDDAYVGHQGVYKIEIDGKLYKYGKLDMTNVSNRTGIPIRLQTQVNRLKRLYPRSKVTGRVIYQNKNISTLDIKAIETAYIQEYYDKYGKEPEGNRDHPGLIK